MVLVHGIEVRTLGGQQHVNLSTHTADGGLSKIQFRTAGSRMLRSVFFITCTLEKLVYKDKQVSREIKG